MKRYWLLIFDPTKEATNKFSFIRHCGSIEEALFDAQENGLESYQVFDSLEKKVVTVIGAGQPLYEYVIPFSIIRDAFQRAVNEKLNVDLFPIGDPGYRILMRKLSYYGPTEAAVEMASDEYIKIHSLLTSTDWTTFKNDALGIPEKYFENKFPKDEAIVYPIDSVKYNTGNGDGSLHVSVFINREEHLKADARFIKSHKHPYKPHRYESCRCEEEMGKCAYCKMLDKLYPKENENG